MLFLSKPTKYVMVEFSTSATLYPNRVLAAATAYINSLEESLQLKLYIRQIATNLKNIIEVYVQPTSPPRTSRTSTSVKKVCSDSLEESTRINFVRQKDCTSTDASPPPRHTSTTSLEDEVLRHQGLTTTSFDTKPVLTPILHRSQAAQTSTSCALNDHVEGKSNTLRKTFIPSHTSINKQRITGLHYHLVRKYLAYFHQPNTFHNGDSHVSTTLQLMSEGLPVREELRTLYFEAMRDRGFENNVIERDLEQLFHYYNVLRVNHLAASRKSVEDYYYGRVSTRGPPPIGTSDPLCCVLM